MLVQTFLALLGYGIVKKQKKVVVSRKGEYYTISENGGAVALSAFEYKVAIAVTESELFGVPLIARDPIDIDGGCLARAAEDQRDVSVLVGEDEAKIPVYSSNEFNDKEDDELPERFIIDYADAKRADTKRATDMSRLKRLSKGRVVDGQIHVGPASANILIGKIMDDFKAVKPEDQQQVWVRVGNEYRLEKKDETPETPDADQGDTQSEAGSVEDPKPSTSKDGSNKKEKEKEKKKEKHTEKEEDKEKEKEKEKKKKGYKKREPVYSSSSSSSECEDDQGNESDATSTSTETEDENEAEEAQFKAAFIKRMSTNTGGIAGDMQELRRREPELFNVKLSAYGINGQAVKAFSAAMGSKHNRPWAAVWETAQEFVHERGYKISNYEAFGFMIRAFYSARRGAYTATSAGIKSTPVGPLPIGEHRSSSRREGASRDEKKKKRKTKEEEDKY